MENNIEISKLIKRHLDEQRFAVLATQSEGQPYANLVAFAEVDNLRFLLFVTSRDTQKYANLLASKKVAVLIDNRRNQASDLNDAIAITALGTVEEATVHNKNYFAEFYLAKHPQLKNFLSKPVNALMKVNVAEYIVATFDGVRRVPIDKIK